MYKIRVPRFASRPGILSSVAPPAGLCDRCRHQRVVRNTRGSSFSMCGRAKKDERYPKYPRLPVLECGGYERDRPGDAPAGEPGTGGSGPRRRDA